ncbi:MAG: aminotransferase class I/II-fold pyridoxal phosphate-dependent enzyme [Phycisphaeraceae bacterium]|nr:aminotransferase class I/II-fold pyridoxal phosphate-dependent enzyme [Phycisphaerae bacterium]MBX3392462.1 aminotransferase class I/II-fold pyridoxal phosphate-dependent enzyme [Phycisphaeraceae bacterium]HRJ50676.1 GntG family PLP-dependent aldolase [Phycisphaerales bacterium]
MEHPVIDLRSDTVTRPTPEMRRAMAQAVVGDDVLGDDPTVIDLQERVAELMGKEAACFVPTGTMANQAAIRAQTEPGDEVIAHEDSHIIHYETGSPAALSGVMIRPARGDRGLYDADQLDELHRAPSIHAPASRLVLIENTQNRGGGAVWPIEQIIRVTGRAAELGLRRHLDGARIWNACAATGLAPADYARHFDTVSCCFSKGLGAPAGSAVAGDRAIIARVARFRKMFGGTMRQSGILAAAALHALERHRDRLTDDHANARRLAEGIAQIPGLSIDPVGVETNMVFFLVGPSIGTAAEFCVRLRSMGVLMLPNAPRRVRAVCHLDVNRQAIDEAIRKVEQAARAAVLV